jgi:hypothetical protein
MEQRIARNDKGTLPPSIQATTLSHLRDPGNCGVIRRSPHAKPGGPRMESLLLVLGFKRKIYPWNRAYQRLIITKTRFTTVELLGLGLLVIR